MIETLYRICPKPECGHWNPEEKEYCVECGEFINPITCMPVSRSAASDDQKSDRGIPEETELPNFGRAREEESDVFRNFDEAMSSSAEASTEIPRHDEEVKVEDKPEAKEPEEPTSSGKRPFRFGLKAFNTEIELSKYIDRDFESCRSLVNDTYRGDLTAWLLSRGHDINDIRGVTHDMSQTEEQRLESLRIFLNPDAPKPQLQTSKAEVSIGWAPQRSNGCSRKIILTNGGSGRLFGTARITGTPAEAFSIGRRPRQREVHVPISGDTTTIYVTSYPMRRRHRSRFQASLVVDTNGGRMDIPVHSEVAPSWVPAWTGGFAINPIVSFVLPIILFAAIGLFLLGHAVMDGGPAQRPEVVIIGGGGQQGGKEVEPEIGSTGTTLVAGQTGGSGIAVLPPVQKPSSIREVRDPVTLRQIDGLLSNYFLYQQDNLLYAQKELYAEEVDFGNRGKISNYEVFTEKKAFLAAWPIPKHEKNGPLLVRYDEVTKRYLVEVETKYDWINPDLRKGRRGRMMHSFELVRESGSTFRIVADHPKTISAQNTQPSVAAHTSPRPVPMPAPPQRDVAADTVRDIVYPVLDGIVRSSTQRRRY